MITVPSLLAGVVPSGPHRCYYCGAACGEDHPASEYVKSSFTGRSGVAAPGSPWVCGGCVACLRESAEITLLGGECRAGKMMRGYSWVVSPDGAFAATKAHIAELRALCLDPPQAPFALVLSDSGQTHQLYRGVVNHARDPITVTLEAERITFRPEQLKRLLVTTTKIAAASGKPSLAEPIDANLAIKVIGRYADGEEILDDWLHNYGSPLSRLAAWLTPKKEVCESVYPGDIPVPAAAPGAGRGGVPAEAGRSRRPAVEGHWGEREGGNQGLHQQALFDPGEPV